MAMREEVKEAMAKTLENDGYPDTAAAVRNERWRHAGTIKIELRTAAAVLTVIDQHEEVEVEECRFLSGGVPMHILRFRDSHSFGTDYGNPVRCTIIRRRKQKPDVPELARRALKAWQRHVSMDRRAGEPVSDAMEALADGLDTLDK